ncbi:NACHT domain-containing protein [Actinomadura verrucosospora]|uniref:Putative signal transduction protein with Nacht domain n=1 Tax=Actinomadura verrucosospora TaxID=46165 RepID=A0A7D3VZQ9_ACTVE|nr:NACHT domain-containing protein [Actinomadura verrucosospora]QKG26870.1 putative signal transduction protein with Nacht domain [Actinomadura verrucosospora]
MSVEVAALRVGTSVARLAVGRWLAGRSTRDAAGKDLTELIRTGFPDEIKRRRAQRQFEGIADSVAERLLTFAGSEFGGLTGGDRDAVLFEVVRTLDNADLSDDAFFAADADPVKLARGLRSRLPARRAEFELGEAGAHLYEVVLDECCDCLARIVVHLPEFGPRASAETLARLSGLADQVGAVLARLPARTLTAPEGEADDAEFTRHYLASISESLDTLELFGVRLERFARPQTTLSVAYISLNVSDESARSRHRAPQAVPLSEWRDQVRTGAVRVEAALADHRLMLLRGEAGGGKSTLLRWLAIGAARGSFTGPLSEWNGSVPFLIKLRSHAGGALPRPEEFLDDVTGNLAGIMPRGWVHRRLLSGRALLLVDGVDEVTSGQRQAVRQWLRKLVTEFPGIRVIVTSRPAAAASDWLRAEGFATAFLEQLAPADVRTLVQHWHNAVRDCADIPCTPERLPSYEARLLARLEAAPHLRTLASSPLLAAMLCALNLDREALPRNRMGLYTAALDMLLETRDTKRGISSVLERDQKIRILQDIAWQLSTSSRVELPKTMVERLVADRLVSMPQVRVPAEKVLDELLQRSGVLREPVPGRIDFVHRTVQEYLAAKQAADLGDMDLLIQNAHRDTWRETVVMAAGHANEPLRRELLTGILTRARTENRRARTLKLVAVACLETLPSIPDDLREDLDRCLDDLIPPRDEASARSLATAGEPVLRRLPETLDGLTEAAAKAVITTAWLINGPEALDILARYASDQRPNVHLEMVRAWDYFDTDKFTEQVLAHCPPGARLTLLDAAPRHVQALSQVPPLADLYIHTENLSDYDFLRAHAHTLVYLGLYAEASMANPALLPSLPRLRALTIGAPGLNDLTFLNDLPGLRELWLPSADAVTDYSPLKRQAGLTILAMTDCPNLTTLAALPPLRSLHTLGVNGSNLTEDLWAIREAAPSLGRLLVSRCDWVRDLHPLAGLPLVEFHANDCRHVDDFSPISSLIELDVLRLSRSSIRDLTPLTSLAKLRTLWLSDCEGLTDLRPLASLAKLRHLHLGSVAPGLDLSPLAGNRKLTVHIDAGQEVRGAEALGRRLVVS